MNKQGLVFICYDLNSTFIYNELRYLHSIEKEVVIIHKDTLNQRFLSFQRFEFIQLDDSNRVRITLAKNFFSITKKVISFFTANIKKACLLRKTFDVLIHIIKAVDYTEQVKIICQNKIIFSYWFDQEALFAAALSEKLGVKYYTRAHAFDLYLEGGQCSEFPLRQFQFKYLETLFAVSKHGEEYLKKIYSQDKNKIKHSYLGTFGAKHLNKINTDKSLKVISVGSVQNRKRTDLIYKILNQVSKIQKVNWTHFGDGPQMEEYFSGINLNSDYFSVCLMGHKSNEDITNFYINESIDFFISLSTNEGIPVSLMEAISFGIPVLATNAGGCSELVNEVTGKLIEIDFKDDEVINWILEFKNSDFAQQVSRNEIANFWNENFNAEINYNSFYQKISD